MECYVYLLLFNEETKLDECKIIADMRNKEGTSHRDRATIRAVYNMNVVYFGHECHLTLPESFMND